jgi:hypothetical protein
MDIQIGELNSTIDTVDNASPALQQTVKAVLQALKDQQANQRALNADLDTRSIIEQQREPR